MDLLLQLWQLGLSMPPLVSAIISMLCCGLVWFGGKKILAKIDNQAAPIMDVLGKQSMELKEQSDDLILIKVQTTKTNGKVETLEKVLGEQSTELNAQSKDLVAIKVQTTKTNGKATYLEQALVTHEAVDLERHTETVKRLDRNQNSTHNLRDQLSDFAIKVGLQAKRNARDIGDSAHKEE